MPLESPVFAGGAVAVPSGDTARQTFLDGASVEVCEGLGGQAEFLQLPEVEEVLLRLLHHSVSVEGPFQVLSEELETFYPLHCSPVDVYEGILSLLCPIATLLLTGTVLGIDHCHPEISQHT